MILRLFCMDYEDETDTTSIFLLLNAVVPRMCDFLCTEASITHDSVIQSHDCIDEVCLHCCHSQNPRISKHIRLRLQRFIRQHRAH